MKILGNAQRFKCVGLALEENCLFLRGGTRLRLQQKSRMREIERENREHHHPAIEDVEIHLIEKKKYREE